MADKKPAAKKKAVRKRTPKVDNPEEKELIGQEIASQDSNIYGQYSFMDYNPDELAKKKGGLKVYQKMKTDEQIKACLTTKKFARLSTPWKVEPGKQEHAEAQKIADFCKYVFENMRTSLGPEITKEGEDQDATTISEKTLTWRAGTFEDILFNIMSALEYGFSISEKIWAYYEEGPFKGHLGIVGCKTKKPFNYDFKVDKYGNLIGIRPPGGQVPVALPGMPVLQEDKQPLLPAWKFVIYPYNSEFNNWYGRSDLREAYRSWWSKDMIIKWMNIYLERFGMPTAVLKYPQKGGKLNKAMIQKLDDILRNLQAKSGFRMPDSMSAELLEAKRQGQAGYIQAIEKHDQGISRSILIPNKTGFGDDEQGSYALGKKHFDVFLIVLEKLGKDLEETIVNEQFIRPLVLYNFGSVSEDLMPKFKFESLLGEDPKPRAEVMKLMKDAGFVDPREDWVREYVNIPKRDLKKYPYMTPIGEPNAPVIPPGGPTPPSGGSPAPGGPGGAQPKDPKKGNEPPKPKPKDKSVQNAAFAAAELSRTPNRFERKVNFQQLKGNLEVLSTGMLGDMKEVVSDMKKDLQKRVLKIFDKGNTREAVRKLRLSHTSEFKNTLRNWLVKTHLDTKLGALDELATTSDFDIDVKRRFSMVFADQQVPFEPWEPVNPTEAINFFNRKVLARVAVAGGVKSLLPLGIAKEMKYYDDRAFYVMGVEEKFLLGQAKNILLTGISKGWAQRKVQEELGNTFEKYLAEGIIRDGKLVSPSRLETIIRTNTTEAYNRGRKAMYDHPEVADRIPYVEWSAILDGRTSAYCENLDGKIFRRGEIDPPPAHFNCRSLLVGITQAEVEEDGEALPVTSQGAEEANEPRAAGFKEGQACNHEHMALDHAKNIMPWIFDDGPEFCMYTSCHGPDPELVKETKVIKQYRCKECELDFKVTKTGDLYLWDIGDEKFVRVTQGNFPAYFKQGGDQ